MTVRDARIEDIESLARVWFESWHEAHAALVPPDIVRHRTLASFQVRLHAEIHLVRVDGPVGRPIGLCLVVGDELSQLFVSPESYGSGVAVALERDAVQRFRRRQVSLAWLACAVGNERAARFYERHGWTRAGIRSYELTGEGRAWPIDVWRYEKRLQGR